MNSFDKKQKNRRTIFFSLIGLNAFVIFLFWLDSSGISALDGEVSWTLAFGRLAGLLLALSVLHQFVLMSRFPFTERYVGTILLQKLHRLNGLAIFYLLLAHPFLVTLAHANLQKISYFEQLLNELRLYPYVWLASIAAGLLIFVIAMSINIVRSRLRYEWWYTVHMSVYLSVVLAFFHQINVGGDFIGNEIFKTYWIALYIVVFSAVLLYRFAKPVWFSHRYGLRVSRVARETHDTVSIYISAKRPLPQNLFLPGQFGIWRFLAPKLWSQAHPFTISVARSDNGLRITPKALGDFTSELHKVGVGTKVVFDGPHGVFTTERLEGRKPLLIAGGIGITPLRSMLEGMGEQAKDTILLYGVQTPEDIALKSELEAIAQMTGAQIQYVYSDKAPAGKTCQYIDMALLKTVPDISERIVALCGPPGMMKAVKKALIQCGVPKRQILTEQFAFTAR